MSVAVITGSAGLIGSEASRFFADQGLRVVGVDNDQRKRFFGARASTRRQKGLLLRTLGERYEHHSLDIRDKPAIERLFRHYGESISLVVHAAAQPSHDWSAQDPVTDFAINAVATLNLLEATRRFAPDAVFLFTSTNKVYGDRPNSLPLVEGSTRYEIAPGHAYEQGITEDMSIDNSMHSLFGVSKASADLLVQEYGRYFGLKTTCFRGGCLTGPGHAGAELHGFLSYLMFCAVTGTPYVVYGYGGKQVRDNIHSRDFVAALDCAFRSPRVGEVYNMGGGRYSDCSVLEAIVQCEAITQRPMRWSYSDQHRQGDHLWWISSTSKFQSHHPSWQLSRDVGQILSEIHDANISHWQRRTSYSDDSTLQPAGSASARRRLHVGG